MNELEAFRQLASQARDERVPAVNVTARVMDSLRLGQAEPAVGVSLWVFAVASLAAAAVVAVMAFQAWDAVGDPLAGLLQPLSVVMQ
ncbi:MAG: hypothetical protein ACYC35_12875 [Pirellulales bacterium]